ILYTLMSFAFGVYRCAWQFASLVDVLVLARFVVTGTALLLAIDFFYRFEGVRPLPFSVVLLTGLIAFLALAVLKARYRVSERWGQRGGPPHAFRTLVVGSNESGQRLVSELQTMADPKYVPTCFVDEGTRHQGLRIRGLPVGGGIDDIPALV